MSEIRNEHRRGKLGISFNDSENRVAEAVRVIFSTGGLDAVASVIKRSILHEIFPRIPRKKRWTGLDIPDYVCYLAYIRIMLLRARKLHPDATKVNFVFAEKEEIKKGMKLVVAAARRFLADEEPELSPLFGDFEARTPANEIPLQAADLISWHLQCNYRGNFPRSDENRMWYLLKTRDGDLHEWTREGLVEFAEALTAA